MVRRSLARFDYAIRRHGWLGAVSRLVAHIVQYGFHRRHRQEIDTFDAKNGTDTGGICEIGTLDIACSPNAIYAERYQASSIDWVRRSLASLDIELSQFAFVDFGSGKGRVLFIAAEFPFREVIGVEFSRELNEIAVANISRLRSSAVASGKVRSVCTDAVSFELPQSHIVCYFYNPFGAAVMQRIVERLVAHHRSHGYRIIVVYADPRHPELFQRTGQFSISRRDKDVTILQTVGEAGIRPSRVLPSQADATSGAADRPAG
jgi:SAM-dependent methyltransferase